MQNNRLLIGFVIGCIVAEIIWIVAVIMIGGIKP
jgi:hypothetical protein